MMENLITGAALADFCAELVRFPSFTGEESHLSEWLAGYFDARGYQVEMQEVESGRLQTIAVLKGTGGGSNLMFNGHLDIDPLRTGWQRDPFSPVVEGDLFYGAGARNMKAGVASMVMAAEAVRLSGKRLQGDLTIACVIGELQGGVGTTYALKHGIDADAAIVPEPVGAGYVVTTTCGVLQFSISTKGFSDHISRKENSASAISMMVRIIMALEALEFSNVDPVLPGVPRLMVGAVIGGVGESYNMRSAAHAADICTATVDVRFLPGQTSESVLVELRGVIDAAGMDIPHFDYDLDFDSRPPYELNRIVFEPAVLSISEPIVSVVSHASEEIRKLPLEGRGAVAPMSYMGADSSHLTRAGIPALLYGPTGPVRNAEDADDCVFISEMVTVSRVLASSAIRFCGQKQGLHRRQHE